MSKCSLRTAFHFVLALCIGAGLAACSARSAAPSLPQEALTTSVKSSSPDAFGSWVYTCSINVSTCPLYTLAGTTPTYNTSLPISGGPSGEFATTSGKWYVALRATSDIAVYTSTNTGPSGPSTTLADAGEAPSDVAVNTAHHVVAVANLFPESDNSNTISVYKNGATSPTRKVHFTAPGGQGGYGVGVATNSRGDCFLSVDDIKLIKFYVVKFSGCKGTGTIVYTSAADQSAGGVAFDGSNNLFLVDNSNDTIYRCHGTTSCHTIASGFQGITFVRFDKGWKHLWTTDKTAAALVALDPTSGHILSTTTEPTAASSLAIAPGPAY